ncbi:MAG: ABC transporter permease [Pseudonocardiales bacterium]|nr:ABC transporter permease [Pseudonocardiales bacterium]MBV9728650.1 ABC transporter permease [Pseudonocardiales bacterium]
MIRLIHAEFRKLTATTLWWWLLLGSLALTALFVSLSIAFDGSTGNPTPPLSTLDGQRNTLAAASGATALVGVLGAIAMTAEFRHLTATPTFLATPRRGRIVAAKLITYTMIGFGFGLACLALTIAIALPWLSAKAITVSLTAPGLPLTALGVLAVMTIYGPLGVGIGALVRNQIAAVVGLLIYLFVLDPVLTAIPALRPVTRYLPGPASAALTGRAAPNFPTLPAWAGGLLLAGYAVVLAALGARFALRRDVT